MWATTSSSESTLQSIGQYIEDYIDLVENVPNATVRQLTLLHEHNHRYHQLLAKLETSLEVSVSNRSEVNETRKRNGLFAVQSILAEIQEISDEKLFIVQSILDQLDSKGKQLDLDYRNVTSGNNGSNNIVASVSGTNTINALLEAGRQSDQAAVNTKEEPMETTEAKATEETPANGFGTSSSNSPTVAKRAYSRRNALTGRGGGSGSHPGGDGPSGSGKGMGKGFGKRLKERGSGSGSRGTARDPKRNKGRGGAVLGAGGGGGGGGQDTVVSSSVVGQFEGVPVDPDEPVYCLCQQVSFGEMIGCDNNSCAIEWFHFSCVGLTQKPRGKWFCPHCRGDRSNVPKK